jgi:RNA polymerase sigma-70 factor (ECF subfamily)
MDPKADERFTRIYETHYLAVLAYCARRVNRSDAEDVSSEVFTVLWKKMDAFDLDAPLPWLYNVALGTIRNRHRATRRSKALTRKIGRTQSTIGSPAPDVVIVRNEQDEEALKTLARLRETDQEVIRLAIWEEMSAREIGLVIGCSTSAAEQRLHRAKKRLAKKLSPTTVHRSDASPQPLEEGGRP